MSSLVNAGEMFKGFSKLTRQERMTRLAEMGALSADDLAYFQKGAALSNDLAENFIENVIGNFSMPMGVAVNFRIDGRDMVIPMAVEETSIIAAASKTARWVRDDGDLTSEQVSNLIIGQVQLAKVQDFARFKKTLTPQIPALIKDANEIVVPRLVARGGGITDITIREIKRPDGASMVVLHVYADSCDAMGANMITQVCEFLKTPVEALTGEQVTMCILSNLTDTHLTKAKVVLRHVEPELMDMIVEASLFADLDPYRAATHNKGVLNGMDPVLIATGNDWRAVEAGVHAYACRDGNYRPVSRWWREGTELHGELVAPITVGIVGGVTRLHPTAQICLRMLGVDTARELSRIVAAVGLVQNLGAINSLVTMGFTQGHLKLHISNLTINVGARKDEIPVLTKRLEEILRLTKRITVGTAREVLRELRGETTEKSAEQV